MSALAPVHAAIYAALTAHAPLTALVTGVYDHVPQGTAYPYVTLGEFTELPAHTHDKEGWEVTATLHVWDDRDGFLRAQQIVAAMDGALQHLALSPTGWGVNEITREFTETIREPDGDRYLRHVVTRWRLRALEAA